MCIAQLIQKGLEQLKEYQIIPAECGLIGGIAGAVLSECLTCKVRALSLLKEVSVNLPDPGAGLSISEH